MVAVAVRSVPAQDRHSGSLGETFFKPAEEGFPGFGTGLTGLPFRETDQPSLWHGGESVDTSMGDVGFSDSGEMLTWPIVRDRTDILRVSYELPANSARAAQNGGAKSELAVTTGAQLTPKGTEHPRVAGNMMVIPASPVNPAALQQGRETPAATVPIPAQETPPAAATPGTAPPAATTTPPPANAETPADAPAESTLTPEIIAARRTSAEQLPDLTDEVKAQIARHFQRATELVAQATEARKKAAELKAEKDNGPALIAEYRSQLTQPPPKAEPEYPIGATVAELDKLRLIDEEKLLTARRDLETWETKSKLRAERKPQMAALIEMTRKQLEDAVRATTGAAPDGELPVVGIARRTEQEALVQLQRAQLDLYRTEQLRYESLNELFPLQRDVLTRAKNSAEKRMELWKIVMADVRREESARQAREAREKLRNAHPTLKTLAESNSALTLRRKELQEFLAAQVTALSGIHSTLVSVEQKFESVKEREKRAGLTTAVGLLLRSQRAHLPEAAEYHRRQIEAEQDIVRLQSEQMPLEDERNDLGDIQAQADLTLSMNGSGGADDAQMREMTVELLTDRREYLDDLLADYDSCLLTLSETDVACRRLETMIREYESYIDERVLWIRSAPAIGFDFPSRMWDSAQSFVSHRQWAPLARFVVADMQTGWPLYGLFAAGFGLILGLNYRGRRIVAQLGETSQKQMDSGIPLTLLATALTTLMSSGWPALLCFVGWRISRAGMDLASALAVAFYFCAGALWLVDTFRTMCRRRGVADSFLGWEPAVVRNLHANLLLYVAGGIPLSFIVGTAGHLDEGTSADSVGRLAFISFCLLLAVMLWRIVRPTGPVIGNVLRASPNSLMYRLRWLWYPMAVGSPLCLAVLACLGYQYTAEQLMIRLQLTLVLSIVILITYSMLMQWMLTAKRNLAMKQARARRAAALAAAQREATEDGGATSPIPPAEIPQVDLSLLNQQMLRLVRGTACILFLSVSWGIWGQVLPALQVFSRIELWQTVVETAVETSPDAGTVGIREVTRVEPVTLGHLLFTVVVISASVVASRNLPGLLELSVLQRLPMDHGGRHAITTLCRYAFLFAGTIIGFNAIGLRWGSVQWLVAALSVGLGFGLQEIFANFVSGLIILFERPIRIGDLVTIDGVSGCVSRIQIRATTITDWDRKEYIVPNKEFVTGKLLNWTLSDKVNRVVIEIGVAYGTDTEKALEMLAAITDEHPIVLKDPAPVFGFEGFGDSCLKLVLRCYLPNFDHRLKVITQLHVAIDRRFKDAGIEIAFPQRDLHIRSLPPQLASAMSIIATTPEESVADALAGKSASAGQPAAGAAPDEPQKSKRSA